MTDPMLYGQDYIHSLVEQVRVRFDLPKNGYVTDKELFDALCNSLNDSASVAILDAGIIAIRKHDLPIESVVSERKAFLLSRAAQWDGVK